MLYPPQSLSHQPLALALAIFQLPISINDTRTTAVQFDKNILVHMFMFVFRSFRMNSHLSHHHGEADSSTQHQYHFLAQASSHACLPSLQSWGS